MVQASRELVAQRLNHGTTGNVSVRLDQSFLLTPCGVPVEQLTPEGMVEMDDAGTVLGQGKPSSEWRFHRDILAQRADVGAVVHTHSRYATALACLGRELPAFHYMVAAAGGDSVRCAPYALFGSQELSDAALLALRGRKACLLGNHGMIALGRDLHEALALALELELLCEQYWAALQLGQPHLLSQEQMRLVLEKFQGYGRDAKP